MPARIDIDPASAQRFVLQGTQFVAQLDTFFNNAPAGVAASLAKEYTQAVERNILTQKFAGGYPEYDPRYKMWKISKVGHSMFWLLFGNIIFILGIWKSALGGYEGGIPAGEVVRVASADQEENLGRSLAGIAYKLEFEGVGKKRKKRPLFGKTFEEFKSEAMAIVKPKMAGALKVFWQGATK